MRSALDIGTHFVAGQKVSHLTSFSSHSSYIRFIFEFVTIEIYTTFTVIWSSCSRVSTMHTQMYKVGESVRGSAEHSPCFAWGGAVTLQCTRKQNRPQCISQCRRLTEHCLVFFTFHPSTIKQKCWNRYF